MYPTFVEQAERTGGQRARPRCLPCCCCQAYSWSCSRQGHTNTDMWMSCSQWLHLHPANNAGVRCTRSPEGKPSSKLTRRTSSALVDDNRSSSTQLTPDGSWSIVNFECVTSYSRRRSNRLPAVQTSSSGPRHVEQIACRTLWQKPLDLIKKSLHESLAVDGDRMACAF